MATKYDEATRSIGKNAKICWTCGGAPNPENFGGLCDPCNVAKAQRLANNVKVLEQYGQTDTQEYRALKALGY